MAVEKAKIYDSIIENVFFNHYEEGATTFHFNRDELSKAASDLGINAPLNLGDLIYSFRFRKQFPERILATAEGAKDKEWVIELAGRSKYRFRLSTINRLIPTQNAYQIKIPDATPEIIIKYAKSDEQALLAKVRYNRLVDIFLRITAYSLQNHLRTTVKNYGQIEVDELYVGVRDSGQQFIVPVQAKGGGDQLAAAQTQQDLAFCAEAYPALTRRALAVQFMDDDVIAMFELTFQGEVLSVVNEKHYRLVPGDSISDDELRIMAAHSE